MATQKTTATNALYTHKPRPHVVRNAHTRHQEEKAGGSFNTRFAVWLTKNTGTMQCAYIFAGIGIGSLVGVFTGNVVLAAVFGSISSYFLQLVLLPVLSVGQGVLGRHAELQSEEQYKAVLNTEHDAEQTIAHLSQQDTELLKQTAELLKQTPMLQQILAHLKQQQPTPAAAVATSMVHHPDLKPIPPAATATRATQPTASKSRSRKGTAVNG